MGNDDQTNLNSELAEMLEAAKASSSHTQKPAKPSKKTSILSDFNPSSTLPALLKRPLLVGGLGLSATLALLGSAHFNPLDSSTLLSAIALGSGLWWWRRGDKTPAAPKPIAPPVVDRPRVEAELAELAALIETLAQERALVNGSALALDTLQASLTGYRHDHQALVSGLERQTLQIAIAGDPRTGKTTLLTLLQATASDQALTAAPRPIKVRRHQSDGTVVETMETPEPAIAGLQSALAAAFVAEHPTLVAATVLRQTQALRQRVQTDLNRLRRDRAMPLIDQLQWVAGATAFANPVPTLDLLATVAINGQLILDLGKLYGFNLSLDEAKTAAGTLASLTVKLGLVELSTQVLTAVLKSHFATYLAGGLVQGLSAAYLTRMASLSLVDYFEQAALAGTPTTALSWEAIAQRLQTTVQQNRQLSLLQTLAKQGIDILKPTPAESP